MCSKSCDSRKFTCDLKPRDIQEYVLSGGSLNFKTGIRNI